MIHSQKPQHSPEQQEVIDQWGQGMAVLAGAGSGKTTTLVSKCLRLLELQPDARFAAVSFTEKSAGDLRAKLAERLTELGQPSALSHHWVTTIHGLCGSIIQEFPQAAGFDAEDRVISPVDAELLWEQAMEGLWFDDLPESVRLAFERLLDRESRDTLSHLLKRSKELSAFGLLESLQKSHDLDSEALGVVAQYVISRYERLKMKRGMLDFTDLEQGAYRALQNEEVRRSYHQRFHLLLVDEFQDTNPLQAQIILSFSRPDASNLCVVGDPKQSIYRFRDADVSVFEEFCSRLPKQYSLTWNFRSRPGIIEFANDVCEKAFQASEMRFDPLIPKRSVDPQVQPVVHLGVESPQDLAQWILQQKKNGVRLEEMALLVRKIRGNEIWFRSLMASGIPVSIGSGGLFWDDPRVRELVAFLRWWVFPHHSLSGGIFLRSPWMKIADRTLDEWIRKDPTWRDPFFTSSHPVAQSLQSYRTQPVRAGDLLMALLATPEIEKEIGVPLLGLWHRVEDLSLRGLDLFESVMELSRAVEESRREREVPAPRALGQISILTLHGAKGLEFPYVILIDFPERPRQADMPLLYWDRQEGGFLGVRDEDGQRDRKHPSEVKWRNLERLKNLAESKRLFYVALTRAREQLVLVTPQSEVLLTRETADAVAQALAQDDWRAWLECSPQTPPPERVGLGLQRPIPALPSAQRAEAFQILMNPLPTHLGRARHSVTEWSLLSRCPRAYEWKFIRPKMMKKTQQQEVNAAVLLGTLAEGPRGELSQGFIQGSVQESIQGSTQKFTQNLEFNLILEQVTPMGEGRQKEEQKEEPVVIEGVKRLESLEGVEEGELSLDQEMSQKELGTRVHQALEQGQFEDLRRLEQEVGSHRFLAEPVLRWAMNSSWMKPRNPQQGREVWTEFAFEVPLKGEVLVGSLDRLIYEETEEGPSYSIIDFKVSQKPRSVQALKAAYQTQMDLYAAAVAALDPQVSRDQIRAWIVNISGHTVQIVSMEIQSGTASRLIKNSLQVIGGAEGEPQPSAYCKMCEFAALCPDSHAHSSRDESVQR